MLEKVSRHDYVASNFILLRMISKEGTLVLCLVTGSSHTQRLQPTAM